MNINLTLHELKTIRYALYTSKYCHAKLLRDIKTRKNSEIELLQMCIDEFDQVISSIVKYMEVLDEKN